MADCYTPGELVEATLRKIATQYRGSCTMQDFFTVYMEELELIQQALCESADLDIDRIGTIINFPRCWCNIKKQKFFGMSIEATPFFGFAYVDGEEELATEECIGGLDESRWIENGQSTNCTALACCTHDNPTILGFCDGVFDCHQTPRYIDHCFDDDDEYTRLIQAKLLSDNAVGTVDEMLQCAKILYGEQCSVLQEGYGTVLIAINRQLTDHEFLLMDFYKNLFPTPVGVKLSFTENLYPLFGMTNSSNPCTPDHIQGFCEGQFLRSL